MNDNCPQHPLALPLESWANEELSINKGPSVIPKDLRKTVFPVITKEDVFEMLLSLPRDPAAVVAEFTETYRTYVGANFALATASGTSSLHLALVGAGVEPGDEVIVPAFSFIATAQAVVAAKAIPVFADIDPATYCLDPTEVEKLITRRTKAIMPVHVHGLPADVKAIQALCDRYSLQFVEDASHAHSAKAGERVCGSIGDAAGQSLMADKNFPVGGEGGIAFFKTSKAFSRAKEFLENSGIDYGMSPIVAAFGLSQLRRLDYYNEIRWRNARYLSGALGRTTLFTPPLVPAGSVHSYNMYRIGLKTTGTVLETLPIHRVKGAIQDLLVAEGVPAREWQNMPLPGHLPFRNRIGFGNHYPFSLAERGFENYRIENFPRLLHMLESTLVLCRELRSPVEYERLQAYALAFKKIDQRHEAIRAYTESREFELPYQTTARLG